MIDSGKKKSSPTNPSTPLHKLKADIYTWLKSLPPHIVKHIFTVKIPANQELLRQILHPYKTKTKGEAWMPSKLAELGFYATNGAINHRDVYRLRFYPKHEVEKNSRIQKISQDLVKNLTITRVDPLSISVSSSYLLDLETALEELSKGTLLHCTSLKQQFHQMRVAGYHQVIMVPFERIPLPV